jgi:bifunctional non-homologous end joining protein LigD
MAQLGPGCLLYVVQKHRARALHYDFRLEVSGGMPSWSIPKGPTLDSGVRRLAMPTGVHDLEHRKFEGGIPRGEYGAGAVMVRDEGTYNPELEVRTGVRREVRERAEAEEVARSSLTDGNLKFRLYGKKLKGSFALVKTAGMQKKEAWLLIKHRDEFVVPGYDANDYDFSAASGLTLAEIEAKAAGADAL